jgi:hypothetical protein
LEINVNLASLLKTWGDGNVQSMGGLFIGLVFGLATE